MRGGAELLISGMEFGEGNRRLRCCCLRDERFALTKCVGMEEEKKRNEKLVKGFVFARQRIFGLCRHPPRHWQIGNTIFNNKFFLKVNKIDFITRV